MAKEITGDDDFTAPKFFSERLFTVSISGTFDADVIVQRVNGSRREPATDSSDWKLVKTYTGPAEENGIDTGGHWYRIGVATGDFTIGTAVVDIY